MAIVVRTRAGALLLDVTNAAAPRTEAVVGTGNGLRGLRERVGAQGGSLEAAATPEGGWRLAARLPFNAIAAVDSRVSPLPVRRPDA